jgi:hypothetical protein
VVLPPVPTYGVQCDLDPKPSKSDADTGDKLGTNATSMEMITRRIGTGLIQNANNNDSVDTVPWSAQNAGASSFEYSGLKTVL